MWGHRPNGSNYIHLASNYNSYEPPESRETVLEIPTSASACDRLEVSIGGFQGIEAENVLRLEIRLLSEASLDDDKDGSCCLRKVIVPRSLFKNATLQKPSDIIGVPLLSDETLGEKEMIFDERTSFLHITLVVSSKLTTSRGHPEVEWHLMIPIRIIVERRLPYITSDGILIFKDFTLWSASREYHASKNASPKTLSLNVRFVPNCYRDYEEMKKEKLQIQERGGLGKGFSKSQKIAHENNKGTISQALLQYSSPTSSLSLTSDTMFTISDHLTNSYTDNKNQEHYSHDEGGYLIGQHIEDQKNISRRRSNLSNSWRSRLSHRLSKIQTKRNENTYKETSSSSMEEMKLTRTRDNVETISQHQSFKVHNATRIDSSTNWSELVGGWLSDTLGGGEDKKIVEKQNNNISAKDYYIEEESNYLKFERFDIQEQDVDKKIISHNKKNDEEINLFSKTKSFPQQQQQQENKTSLSQDLYTRTQTSTQPTMTQPPMFLFAGEPPPSSSSKSQGKNKGKNSPGTETEQDHFSHYAESSASGPDPQKIKSLPPPKWETTQKSWSTILGDPMTHMIEPTAKDYFEWTEHFQDGLQEQSEMIGERFKKLREECLKIDTNFRNDLRSLYEDTDIIIKEIEYISMEKYAEAATTSGGGNEINEQFLLQENNKMQLKLTEERRKFEESCIRLSASRQVDREDLLDELRNVKRGDAALKSDWSGGIIDLNDPKLMKEIEVENPHLAESFTLYDLHEFEVHRTQYELNEISKEYNNLIQMIYEKYQLRLEIAENKAKHLGLPIIPARRPLEQKRSAALHALELRTAKTRKHLKKTGGRWLRHEFPPNPNGGSQFSLTQDTIDRLKQGEELDYNDLFPSSAPEKFKQFYGFDLAGGDKNGQNPLEIIWAPMRNREEDDEDEMDLLQLSIGDQLTSINGCPVITYEQAERELRRAHRISGGSNVLLRVFHQPHFAPHPQLDAISTASQEELNAELEELEFEDTRRYLEKHGNQDSFPLLDGDEKNLIKKGSSKKGKGKNNVSNKSSNTISKSRISISTT